MGSETTGRVCETLKRNFEGYDLKMFKKTDNLSNK